MKIDKKRLIAKEMYFGLAHEGFEDGGFYDFSEFPDNMLSDLIGMMTDEQLEYLMSGIESESLLGLNRNQFNKGE